MTQDINALDMEKGPAMILLIGPPACGKSTWRAAYSARRDEANHLATAVRNVGFANNIVQEQRRTTVLSTDDIIDREAARLGITYDEAFNSVTFKDLDREMKEDFAAALERGDDIIVDRTNMSAKARNKFLARARQSTFNYQTVGVVFEVTEEELRRRRQERFEATGKSVPEDIIAEMMARYEPPMSGEFNFVTKGN